MSNVAQSLDIIKVLKRTSTPHGKGDGSGRKCVLSKDSYWGEVMADAEWNSRTDPLSHTYESANCATTQLIMSG